jgi:hypothetical protein
MNGVFLQGDEQRIPKEIVPTLIGSNGVFPVDEMHNQFVAAAHNILNIFRNVVKTKSPQPFFFLLFSKCILFSKYLLCQELL